VNPYRAGKRETFTDSFDTLVAFNLDEVPGMITTRALYHDRFNGSDFHTSWRRRLDFGFGSRNRSRKEGGAAENSAPCQRFGKGPAVHGGRRFEVSE